MDINAILAAMNAEGYSVKDVSADDLSAHLAALTEARDALAANVQAGTVTADADVIEATRATVDAIATLEAEIAERAAAGAQAQADLAQMLGLDAEANTADAVEETETVDQVDEVREPVAAGYKPFAFPDAPKAPERTPVADKAVTASAEPAVKYYTRKGKESPNRSVLADAELRAQWSDALSVNVGNGKRRIAIAEVAYPDAVKASDYATSKDSSSMLADAHAKWKAGRDARLMSNRPGLSARQAVTAATCVAPARPVLDIGTPCPVTSFVDDLPTVVSNEKLSIYPRPEVDYSQVQAGVFTVTETQHNAGYVSEGGTTPDKECAQICPGDPIECEPIATGFCVERDTFTDAFWPSAAAASEAILMNFAKLQADYLALEKMFDPTNGNSAYVHKPAAIATSDFGIALDMLDWLDQLKNVIAACTGCDPDSLILPDFLLRRAVADHQKRFGTRVSEAASEVLSALGNQDGMTVRTYSHAPQTWLLSGGAATLSDGSLLSPSCIGTGDDLATGTPARAAIFVGFTDGLSVVRNAEIEMSVQKPSVNKTQYLSETIATTCVTRSHWVLDVPVCVKGAVGAMAAVTCPA